MKQAIGILVLVLAGWLAITLVSTDSTAAPPMNFTSSKDCRDCHSEIYAEWEASHHAISWTNPAPRLLSNDFAKEDCIDCHAPRPIFVTGIGERVLPRQTRRVEGVDCISCHQLPAKPDGTPGGMAGTLNNPSAPCNPTVQRDLIKPEFCAGCHNQHKTVDQWRASSFADGINKQDCLDCHMPYVEDANGRHRTHRLPGGDDMDLVRGGVELTGANVDGNWVLTLANTNTGHSFPTDERSRAGDVFWRPLAAAGAEPGPWQHLHRLRSPYRDEVDIPYTLLLADEVRTIPVLTWYQGAGEPVAATQPIEVALYYKRTPYYADPSAPDPEADLSAHLVTRFELNAQ